MSLDKNTLSGKVALVTGATRGIGRSVALLLAHEGADVAAAGLNVERGRQVAEEIGAIGRRSVFMRADVSSGAEVDRMVAAVLEEFQHIDILVNSAGVFEEVPIIEMTEAQWDRVMNINLKGTFNCTKAVARHMIERRCGRIVNVASDAGKTGGAIPVAHYAASKAGIISFTKSAAREFAPYGINVNAVSPGVIDTDMAQQVLSSRKVTVPLGRLGTPEDVASAVLFLVSAGADYITGEILDVNGGLVMD